MLKFSRYCDKGDEDAKLSLDWFTFEDHFHRRYSFGVAAWDPEKMEQLRIANLNRYKNFKIHLNLFYHHFILDIRLKKVGLLRYGKLMKDKPNKEEI